MRKSLFAAALVLLAGCGGSVLPQIHDPANRVDVAKRLLAKGDATLAIEVLAPFTTSGSGAANVDEAIYLLGQCKLQTKDFSGAQADFERLVRDYPESDSSAAAVFRIGEAMWGQARGPDFDQEYTLKALDQWLLFRREHADHWLAETAQRRIGEARARLATKLYRTGDLYVKLKEYAAAKRYFKDVMNQYSETPVSSDALLGWAVASARLGERDTALALLREVEQENAGQPLGVRAARLRAEVEHWGTTVKPHKRKSTPNEPPPPGSATPGLTP